MIFSEIYGAYFNAVAAILTEAAEGTLTGFRLTALVQKNAFTESTLSIPKALKTGRWPLLTPALQPVLRHRPTMPLSTLQKRWMKALLSDPRLALFAPDTRGLEDVEPLYGPDTFVYFDRYLDGDPFTDPAYIARVRLILRAIREEKLLLVKFCSRTGRRVCRKLLPRRLEYSSKDDKFRVFGVRRRKLLVFNLGRLEACELLGDATEAQRAEPMVAEPPENLVLRLRDERHALDRALLHFSHLEKETRRLSENEYEVRLRYDREDETELLIRVLSFGPMVKVTAPARLVAQVQARLRRQAALMAAPPE